jgi:hypothetical protein
MKSKASSIQYRYNSPRCGICGKEYARVVNRRSKLAEDGICPDCSYWRHLADKGLTDGMYCVKGVLYRSAEAGISILPDNPAFIYIPYSRTAVRIGSLTRIGAVPEQWKGVFSDNGVFIDGKTYRMISARQQRGECDRIGCYDRYHCLWYTPELHEADGPWNIIPAKHKIGGEHCPAFIDKEYIDQFI